MAEITGIDIYNFKDEQGNIYNIRDGRFISNMKDSDKSIYPLVKMIKGSDNINVKASLNENYVPQYEISVCNYDENARTCNSLSIIKDGTKSPDNNYLVVRCKNESNNTYYLIIDKKGLSASSKESFDTASSKQLIYIEESQNQDLNLNNIVLKNIYQIESQEINATEKLVGKKLIVGETLATIDEFGKVTAQGYYLKGSDASNSNLIKSIDAEEFTIDSNGKISLKVAMNKEE